jgi:hypothetical protein
VNPALAVYCWRVRPNQFSGCRELRRMVVDIQIQRATLAT